MPCPTRGAQAALSPSLGAPATPAPWQAEHVCAYSAGGAAVAVAVAVGLVAAVAATGAGVVAGAGAEAAATVAVGAAALAAAAGAFGSSNFAPPLFAMKTTARPISRSLKSPPPCGPIAP